MFRLKRFEYFMIYERLGVNQDVENLSNYLSKIIKYKSITISNLPIKLSKPINKIVIDIVNNTKYDGRFNIDKSKLTEKGWDLYFIFNQNPSIDLIFHEVNHAYKFIMMGKENSIKELNKIKAAKRTLNTIGKKLEKLELIADLIYYLDNSEIDSMIAETYADIKELSKKYNIDKKTFIDIINQSESIKICNFVDNLNLSQYLNEIDNRTKVVFFSLLKKNTDMIKIKRTFFQEFKHIIKNIFSINFWKINFLTDKEVKLQMDKLDFYFKTQSKKLRRKIHRLSDITITQDQ